MTESRQDVRQHRSRDLLDQIAGATDKDLDVLLRSANKEFTPPLRMKVTGLDRVVTIENLSVQNPETGVNRIIPPVSNLLPLFWNTGTVTAPTTNNSNATTDTGPSTVLVNITDGEYQRLGISLNGLGQIQLTVGEESTGGDASTATAPVVPNNTFGIGHVLLSNTGGTINVITSSEV